MTGQDEGDRYLAIALGEVENESLLIESSMAVLAEPVNLLRGGGGEGLADLVRAAERIDAVSTGPPEVLGELGEDLRPVAEE